MFDTLISAEEAAPHIADANWIFVDCRYTLTDAEAGWREYQQAHIKGAVFASTDTDLSGAKVKGKTGRHPLPSTTDFAHTLGRLGINNSMQVVVYDGVSGQSSAARLWWMLKWAGHQAVAVLDGGIKYWQSLSLPCASGIENRAPQIFTARYRPELIVNAEQVGAALRAHSSVLLDARAADRFRGENEVIDPIAGHIPGATSVPVLDVISADGRLKSTDELRAHFATFTQGKDAANVIMSCGSGVSATLNVLAYLRANKALPLLYAGSWSDWITNPDRPIAKG